MSEQVERSKNEIIKENSRQLRGDILADLQSDSPEFGDDSQQLLKFHGMYQQDDRDVRKAKNEDGTPKGKTHIVMIRARIPGGNLTADQFLGILDLSEKYANGAMRLTTRQGIQLHYVPKDNTKAVVKGINDTMLTTLAACGDVNRNVMACPAPIKDQPHAAIQKLAYDLAEHFRPKTTAYHELWLTDDEGNSHNATEIPTEFTPVEEPIYGSHYLPRKFKMAIALPDDNCIDVYSNDLGLIADVQGGEIVGYNLLVGGGMGRTPAAEKTFPAVAKKLCYVTPEQVIPVSEAVVKVQRDFGNRADRKVARLKYLINNWGLEKFKAKVEEYYGGPLTPPTALDVKGVEDHVGWFEQGDGKLFVGINVECGRVRDTETLKVKSGLRAVIEKYRMPVRTTALQGVILCDIDPAHRADITAILKQHGIKPAEELTILRRYAIACPALPTCGLSLTESERVLPSVIDKFDIEMAKLGLQSEKITVHMTGCNNGCARPYTPDIGFVGRSLGKYTIFVGGNPEGSRLAFLLKDQVPLDDLVPTLVPLLVGYKAERQEGEGFGDYCVRKGLEGLQALATEVAV